MASTASAEADGDTVHVEAEQASERSTGSTDGPGWNISSNGYIEQRVVLAGGSQELTVRARANSSSGRAPIMEVRVDGVSLGRTDVHISRNWEFEDYKFTVATRPGAHDVAVAFVNDSKGPWENLDLIVDWFEIRPTGRVVSTTPTPPVTPITPVRPVVPPAPPPPVPAPPVPGTPLPVVPITPPPVPVTPVPTTVAPPVVPVTPVPTTVAPPVVPAPGDEGRSAYVPDGYSMTWNDEFDSLSLDIEGDGGQRWATNWLRWNVLSLDGNGDQCMKAHPGHTGTGGPRLGLETHRVDDGVLTLFGRPIPQNRRSQFWGYQAACGMISGEKSHAQTYGYWETRMRIPNVSRGHHWAVWLLPENGSWPPEVDMLEVVGSNAARNTDERRFHFTGHYNDQNGTKQSDMGFRDAPGAADDWYTLGLEWTADSVIWHLDGQEVHRMPNFVGTDPNYFLISPEIGGNWPGPTDSSTRWPMTMEVDYVRIYAK